MNMKQQKLSNKHLSHSLHRTSRKQRGFVAMPAVGIAIGVGLMGTLAVTEKPRVNYDMETNRQQTTVHQANTPTSKASTATHKEFDDFIQTYD